MKRFLALMLVFAALFAFAGCSKKVEEPKDVDLSALMSELKGALEFPEMMEKSEADLGGYGYELGTGDVLDMAYIIASSGLTPEEIFLAKLKDADTANTVKAQMEARRDAIADMAQDYIPEEMEKITKAVIGVEGSYAYFAITSDNAKAKEIIEKAL